MGTIRTYAGKYVDPMNLTVDDVCIEDIAHALSLTCRFGGHSLSHYSVAEHSLMVEGALQTKNGWKCGWHNDAADRKGYRSALLHDATEAYLGDMVRPVKHGGEMETYVQAERRAAAVIAEKFNLYHPELTVIKVCDREVLEWEQEWVFSQCTGLDARAAERMFLERYKVLSD